MAKKVGDREKIRDLENQLRRALADYSNLQKRIEQEKNQIISFTKAVVITKFLQSLDTLEATERSIKENGPEQVTKGVEIALKEFKKTLEEEGVEEIATSGGFDPRIHEAIEVIPGKEDNKIVDVLEKGYKIDNKILRAARVKVSKKGAK